MRNKVAYTIARLLLGLAFLVFGVGKFIPFMNGPVPPQPALDFYMALTNTGYFIPVLGIVEIVVGLLLLVNFWVPFTMILLAPVMVHILLFALFLSPSAGGIAFVSFFALLQVYIMYCTWSHYKPLFTRKN